MAELNLINKQEKEKLEKIGRLFWKTVIIIMSCGFTSIMLCILLEVMTSSKIAKFFDDLIDLIITMTLLPIMVLFVPFWIYNAYRGFFSSKKSPNKILVINNLAEISTNKSDEPKYTEKDVIAIVNGLIKKGNYPEENNIASTGCYASAINDNDSSTSSLWSNQHNWHTSSSSSDSFSDRYNNPSSSYYHSHHSSSSSSTSNMDHHNRYCNSSHPLYKAHHST